MATRIGPRHYAIPSGLILLWDAADTRSYTPSASIIYDLVGNYNGTVGAGCLYSTNGGGSITIRGPNAIISNTSINLTYEKYTVVAVTRYTGASDTRGRMLNAVNNNWLLGNWGGQAEKYYAEGWISDPSGGPSDTTWRVFTGTGDPTTDDWKLYVNSELRASNGGGSQGPNGIVIGRSYAYGENSEGEFSFLAIYNRILTEREILINYGFIKGRYNLP